jgi:predicted ATPase
MERHVSSPELSGRGGELATMRAALERAERGVPEFLLVGGEAGIGKTRLVREFASDAEAEGAMVLVGECVEVAVGELPFAPLASALRPVARTRRDQLRERIGPRLGELSALLPDFADTTRSSGDDPPALEEQLARSRFFELVLALLLELAEERALALAIEDLHWADRSTFDLLTFVGRNAIDSRLLLIGTYRTEELHRREPLQAFLDELRRRGARAIELDALTRDEMGAMIRGIRREAGDELIERIHERSDGNPFFAEELLAGTSEPDEPLPTSLREALIARIARVRGPAREALRVIAVGQRPVEHELVAALVPGSERELLTGLREAAGAHLLVERGGAYELRHALVREAIYSDLLPGERAALHAAMAQALAGWDRAPRSTRWAELAHHWLHAGANERALDATVRAGAEAERLRAFAEARRQFEAAHELWDRVEPSERPRGVDRVELIAGAAQNAYLSGEFAAAASLAQDAIASLAEDGDEQRLALLRERLGRYLWVSGQADASEAAYRAAVELIPADRPSSELARVEGALAQVLMLRGRLEEASDRCRRAIATAEEVGASSEGVDASITLGVVECFLGDRTAAISRLSRAKRIAEELGLADQTLRAYVCLGDALDQDGRLHEAAELALEGMTVAERLGVGMYADFIAGEAAFRLHRLGRLPEAARAAALGGREPSGDSGVLVSHARAELALARGELARAERALEAAERALGGMREPMF